MPVETALFTHFFRQVWRQTVKSHSLTESVLCNRVRISGGRGGGGDDDDDDDDDNQLGQ